MPSIGSDKKLPQIARMRNLLSRGIGVHHGGLLPLVKEVGHLPTPYSSFHSRPGSRDSLCSRASQSPFRNGNICYGREYSQYLLRMTHWQSTSRVSTCQQSLWYFLEFANMTGVTFEISFLGNTPKWQDALVAEDSTRPER
jgi:hypothetical protein